MKYFIYRRKSQEDEDRQVMSLTSQQDEIDRLIEANADWEIVEHIEEAKSAKSPGRPKFDEMMNRIEAGEAQGIIAWHPDRLARNSVDGGRIVYDLDNGALKDLKFCTYNFQDDPQGKFMLNLIFAQSKFYVDALSVNVKRGIRTKLKQGWRPNLAPVGYRNCRETSTIKPDPKHFKMVRRVFDLKLVHQKSVSEIHQVIALQDGYITPLRKSRGGKSPSRSMIYRILTNPFYAGYILWNGQLHIGKHKPVVSKTEFEQTQRELGISAPHKPKTRSHTYAGVFRCGVCGLSITAEYKQKPSGREYTYYHCTRVHRTPHCTQPSIEEQKLEQQVLAFIEGIGLSKRLWDWLADATANNHIDKSNIREEQQNDQHTVIAKLERQLANLTDLRVRDILNDDEFMSKRQSINMGIDAARERIAELQNSTATLEPTRNLSMFLFQAKYWYLNANKKHKRRLLEILCSNSVLTDRKALLEAKKPFLLLSDLDQLSFMRGRRSNVGTPKLGKRLEKKLETLCRDPEVKLLAAQAKEFCEEFMTAENLPIFPDQKLN